MEYQWWGDGRFRRRLLRKIKKKSEQIQADNVLGNETEGESLHERAAKERRKLIVSKLKSQGKIITQYNPVKNTEVVTRVNKLEWRVTTKVDEKSQHAWKLSKRELKTTNIDGENDLPEGVESKSKEVIEAITKKIFSEAVRLKADAKSLHKKHKNFIYNRLYYDPFKGPVMVTFDIYIQNIKKGRKEITEKVEDDIKKLLKLNADKDKRNFFAKDPTAVRFSKLKNQDDEFRAKILKILDRLGELHLESLEYSDFPGDFFVWLKKHVLTIKQTRAKEEKEDIARRCKFVHKRLDRELVELQKDRFPTINAFPVFDNNKREWHGNICGQQGSPYNGVIIHFKMQFRFDYPHSPPEVFFFSPVHHPNVFCRYSGSRYTWWVCLDLLDLWNTDTKRGWSNGYTVSTVLQQLQSFLFDKCYKRIDTKGLTNGYRLSQANSRNARIDRCIKQAKKLMCTCGHTHANPVPNVERHRGQVSKFDNSVMSTAETREYLGIPSNKAVKREIKNQKREQKEKERLKKFKEKEKSKRARAWKYYQANKNQNKNMSALGAQAHKILEKYMKNESDMHVEEKVKITKVCVGQVLTGFVTQVKDKHIYVDVGYYQDVYVHISKISKKYLFHPGEVVKVGTKVKGKIINISENKISFSMLDYPVHLLKILERMEKKSNKVVNTSDKKEDVKEKEKPKETKLIIRFAKKEMSNEGVLSFRKVLFQSLSKGDLLRGKIISVQHDKLLIDIGIYLEQEFIDKKHEEYKKEFKQGLSKYVRKIPRDLYAVMSIDAVLPFCTKFLWDCTKFYKVGDELDVGIASVNQKYFKTRLDLLKSKRNIDLFTTRATSLKGALDVNTTTMYADINEVQASSWKAIKNSNISKILPYNSFGKIMRFLDADDLQQLSSTCKVINLTMNNTKQMKRVVRELRCYFSRKSWKKDSLCLTINPSYSQGALWECRSELDLVGYGSAKFHNVRLTSRNESFKNILPVYLNRKHSNYLKLAEQAVADICTPEIRKDNGRVVFKPSMVLKVLPALMNGMVVRMMNGQLRESVASMEIYLTYYHLLLAFCEKYPSLLKMANERIERFKNEGSYRTKRECPNLGEFIAILNISSYDFSFIAREFLSEVFDRNVRWTVNKYPDLIDLDDYTFLVGDEQKFDANPTQNSMSVLERYGLKVEIEKEPTLAKSDLYREYSKKMNFDAGRIPKTFKATMVSNRLVMFHFIFMKSFRWNSPESRMYTPMETKLVLDATLGRSTHTMLDYFMYQCKKIKAIDHWVDYFLFLNLPVPSPLYLLKWLQQSAKNSERKRYHYPAVIKKLQEEERLKKMKIKMEQQQKLLDQEEDLSNDANDKMSAFLEEQDRKFDRASRSNYW